MKRSESVNLAVMGVAAFAATFAGATYLARPGGALNQPAQCAPRPDGSQACERRGFMHYFIFGGSGSSSAQPQKTQGAALVSDTRSSASAPRNAVMRGGFGASGRAAFRVSAGG